MPIERLAMEAERLSQMSEDLIHQARWTRWQRVFVLCAVVFMIFLLILQIAISLANRATYTAVKDCTIPGGTCYERGQQSQGRAIAQIAKANLASSWCTAHSKTYPEAQKCVIKLMGAP